MSSKYQDALIKLVNHNYSTRNEKNECINTLQELVDKETKYKLLEEELGIDLLTLFKALKDGIDTRNTSVYGEDLKFRYFIGDPCLEWKQPYQKIPTVTIVSTEDYGKTWWVRKTKGE